MNDYLFVFFLALSILSLIAIGYVIALQHIEDTHNFEMQKIEAAHAYVRRFGGSFEDAYFSIDYAPLP